MKTNKLLLAAALGVASVAMVSTASACSLSAWSATAGTVVANQPNQSPAVARYSGVCAAQADAVGDFVTDSTPAAEATYRARVYVYTGSHTGGTVNFLEARDSGGNNKITAQYNGSQFTFGMAGTATTRTAAVVANRWYSVELAWEASATGSLTITVQGAGSATPIAVTPITGVNNSSDRIDEVRLGKISGSGTGFMNFDAFDSRRTTSPGRLCVGDAVNDGTRNVFDVGGIIGDANGSSLSTGQPDVNEDGSINVFDLGALIPIINTSPACP
ncbi:MAG: hypothetical protein KDI37_08840 [Xanthomonadales bacterium]|nr:hypothetical protein [Xanthomonadales bacterium]MCB1641824.1 hypothetical protein [Xanthomonadales bacterium]